MKRLAFRLPEFCRTSWTSAAAEAAWAPRVRDIASAWAQVEERSVVAGVRRCAIIMVAPADLEHQVARARAQGLAVAELDRVAVNRASYLSATVAPDAGAPFCQRVVIGRADDGPALVAAWLRGDQPVIAELLGYPDCCARFFQRVWVEERSIDTTWAMVSSLCLGQHEVEVRGPPECNVLLRWLGMRPVPHLPCAFDCRGSAALGRRLAEVAGDAGLATPFEWLYEMLDWPIEWSALHGIAEIKTPVLKIATTTDATAEKLTVRRPGRRSPAEAAKGLGFPYRTPKRLRVVDASPRRGPDQ